MNTNIRDYTIYDKLGDTIERLEFSQNQSNPYLLSAGGWDGKFYLWSISLQQTSTQHTIIKPDPEYEIASTQLIISFNLEEPIFSLCWKRNTNLVLAGTVEGSVILMDLETSRVNKIQQLETGVREILHFQDDSFDLIITGSYDGIIRLWDIRDFSAPKAFYDTNNTINSMSLDNYLLFVGMHNGLVCYFNLQKLRIGVFEPEIVFETNFINLLPIYSICAFPNMEGFCCTCLEGKVSVVCFNNQLQPKLMKDTKKLDTPAASTFIFRAHRKSDSLSSMIHQVKVNKVYGTFITCGGDGNIHIWDYQSKTRLFTSNLPGNPPVTATNISIDGNILAYACGEDWSEGHSQSKKFETKIALKYLSNVEKMKKVVDKK